MINCQKASYLVRARAQPSSMSIRARDLSPRLSLSPSLLLAHFRTMRELDVSFTLANVKQRFFGHNDF